ncbi:MAG: hypothetical protein IPF92_02595 [Myxococcales bacterium]|nr:hypothetical protein [Myxococcales bacterium]
MASDAGPSDAATTDAATSDAGPSDAATTDAARPADAAPDAATSTVDCNAQKCSADPATTDEAKKACEDEKAGPCGAQYNAAGSCVVAKLTCGADNKTDQASALKAISDCQAEINAYQSCKAKNSDGGP